MRLLLALLGTAAAAPMGAPASHFTDNSFSFRHPTEEAPIGVFGRFTKGTQEVSGAVSDMAHACHLTSKGNKLAWACSRPLSDSARTSWKDSALYFLPHTDCVANPTAVECLPNFAQDFMSFVATEPETHGQYLCDTHEQTLTFFSDPEVSPCQKVTQ